ncbi:hypothetical protein HDU76_003125 [Blyttiomyces sp. JEL0837]|nr:hypothetical protein HDU76_003125 [Blyttiomyces sp. JEL0837]
MTSISSALQESLVSVFSSNIDTTSTNSTLTQTSSTSSSPTRTSTSKFTSTPATTDTTDSVAISLQKPILIAMGGIGVLLTIVLLTFFCNQMRKDRAARHAAEERRRIRVLMGRTQEEIDAEEAAEFVDGRPRNLNNRAGIQLVALPPYVEDVKMDMVALSGVGDQGIVEVGGGATAVVPVVDATGVVDVVNADAEGVDRESGGDAAVAGHSEDHQASESDNDPAPVYQSTPPVAPSSSPLPFTDPSPPLA